MDTISNEYLGIGMGDVCHTIRMVYCKYDVVSFCGIIVKDKNNKENIGKEISKIYPNLERSNINIDW